MIKRYRKSSAVRELEAMADGDARRRYPTVPYLAPRTFRDDTANGLTKCITAFLKLKGWQAERISTTGRPIDRTRTYTDVMGMRRTVGRVEWIRGTTTRGSADISATIAGRSVKVEGRPGRIGRVTTKGNTSAKSRPRGECMLLPGHLPGLWIGTIRR